MAPGGPFVSGGISGGSDNFGGEGSCIRVDLHAGSLRLKGDVICGESSNNVGSGVGSGFELPRNASDLSLSTAGALLQTTSDSSSSRRALGPRRVVFRGVGGQGFEDKNGVGLRAALRQYYRRTDPLGGAALLKAQQTGTKKKEFFRLRFHLSGPSAKLYGWEFNPRVASASGRAQETSEVRVSQRMM